MRPEQQYQARLMAQAILDGDRPGDRFSGFDEAIHPTVSVDLRGMVNAIRREFHLSVAYIAEKVTAELQRQLDEVDIDEMVRKAVERHVLNEKLLLEQTAERVVKLWVESAMSGVLSDRYESVKDAARRAVIDALRKVSER